MTARRCLAVAVVAVCAGVALAPVDAAPDDAFARIYERSMRARASLQSIQAHFTESTTSTLLNKPIVAHGTVVGAPPARVRMTYADPEAKTVVIDGETLTIVWPDRHERQQIKVGEMQKRIDRYFTRASVNDLQSMFRISVAAEQGPRAADRIEMRPKRKQIKQGLERLDLWIDRDSAMLVQMRMFFPSGDEKTITLDTITTNVPVTDATFRVTP
jgi:outer membrane lipoprotein-sorting protein